MASMASVGSSSPSTSASIPVPLLHSPCPAATPTALPSSDPLNGALSPLPPPRSSSQVPASDNPLSLAQPPPSCISAPLPPPMSAMQAIPINELHHNNENLPDDQDHDLMRTESTENNRAVLENDSDTSTIPTATHQGAATSISSSEAYAAPSLKQSQAVDGILPEEEPQSESSTGASINAPVVPAHVPDMFVTAERFQQYENHVGPSTLAQMLSPPTRSTAEETPGSSSSHAILPRAPPPLSLGQLPGFTSADEPPPYSPTHTILPHYFSLEPIPVRTYIIKDSVSLPFLCDFWLCSTTQQQSSSRPQSPGLQLQERGLTPQHQNELKYCIMRPQHTDMTATPLTNSPAPNAYFIPAIALVAANYPSRWIWWGTEALQMVIFGRQLKNIIMEWRWKHGRMRIGGPIVHRLVGCSFKVTPERKYCWKQGSGKRRPAAATATGVHQQRNRNNNNRQSGFNGRATGENVAVLQPAISEPLSRVAGNTWFSTFFIRAAPGSGTSDTVETESSTNSIPLDHVRVSIPPTAAADGERSLVDPVRPSQEHGTLREQEAAADMYIEDDFDLEELGCYHCREESSSGVTGRIVAVYKPGRPANRARDRPATSRRLEIYAEVGERCETAMMLMCMRLDDLFMSIPDEKKGPLVSSRPSPAVGSNDAEGAASSTGEGGLDASNVSGNDDVGGGSTESGNGGAGTLASDDQRSEVSVMKRLLGSRDAWKSWTKWFVAAILIAVVVVLIVKPKLTHSS